MINPFLSKKLMALFGAGALQTAIFVVSPLMRHTELPVPGDEPPAVGSMAVQVRAILYPQPTRRPSRPTWPPLELQNRALGYTQQRHYHTGRVAFGSNPNRGHYPHEEELIGAPLYAQRPILQWVESDDGTPWARMLHLVINNPYDPAWITLMQQAELELWTPLDHFNGLSFFNPETRAELYHLGQPSILHLLAFFGHYDLLALILGVPLPEEEMHDVLIAHYSEFQALAAHADAIHHMTQPGGPEHGGAYVGRTLGSMILNPFRLIQGQFTDFSWRAFIQQQQHLVWGLIASPYFPWETRNADGSTILHDLVMAPEMDVELIHFTLERAIFSGHVSLLNAKDASGQTAFEIAVERLNNAHPFDDKPLEVVMAFVRATKMRIAPTMLWDIEDELLLKDCLKSNYDRNERIRHHGSLEAYIKEVFTYSLIGFDLEKSKREFEKLFSESENEGSDLPKE
jgi:hypothetical protein